MSSKSADKRLSRSDILAIVAICVSVISVGINFWQADIANRSLQFAANSSQTELLGTAQNVSLARPWYTNQVDVTPFQHATIYFANFTLHTSLNASSGYWIRVQVWSESGIINSTRLFMEPWVAHIGPNHTIGSWDLRLAPANAVKLNLDHVAVMAISIDSATPSPSVLINGGVLAILFRS